MKIHGSEARIINPFKLQSINSLWPKTKARITAKNERLAKQIHTIHASYEIQSNALVNGNSMNGVHSSEGEPLEISFLRRGMPKGLICEAPEYPIKSPEKINTKSLAISKTLEKAFWISSLELNHFGHTLTETASSLFPLLAWDEAGYDLSEIDVAITENLISEKSIDLLQSLLPTLSRGKIHIAKKGETISIAKLFVPHPTMIIRESVSEGQLLATRAMVKILLRDALSNKTIQEKQKENVPKNANTQNPTKPSRVTPPNTTKIWLSRKNVSNRSFPEERELEKKLSEHGWNIICPEELMLDEQLKALNKAKVIAGTMSSSFHLLMGLRKKNITKSIYMLAANQVQTATYFEQFKRQGFRFTIDNCLEYSTTSENQLKVRNGKKIEEIVTSINKFARPALKAGTKHSRSPKRAFYCHNND